VWGAGGDVEGHYYLDGNAPTKKCVIVALYRIFSSLLVGLLTPLAVRLHQVALQAQPATSPRHGRAVEGAGSARAPNLAIEGCTDLATIAEKPTLKTRQQPPKSDGFEDLQITIPIVKPPCWQEVQPLVDGKGVAFDERGWKETMTVKPARWSNFVDRQRAKLETHITDLRRAAKAAKDEKDDEDPWDVCEASATIEDDVAELEQMVERMEDWKDLTRYSGKSISMASTQRGNEMKIHVMAFAEREDGSGVDFMRLSYKKSVEVLPPTTPKSKAIFDGSQLARTLYTLLPFLAPKEVSSDTWERWAQLMSRPDVAKYTIALAFRRALASDGVHLEICDSKLEDAK